MVIVAHIKLDLFLNIIAATETHTATAPLIPIITGTHKMITIEDLLTHKVTIAVLGLGYVGLPLAVKLSKHFSVIGFDIAEQKVANLNSGIDSTREVDNDELASCNLRCFADPKCLSQAGIIIIGVPTPVDKSHNPDLEPLRNASRSAGRYLQKGSIVVYESTVYPGVTEEVCIPILEQESGLIFGQDFTVGYSPERINPGDKIHTVDKVIKVVSGSDQRTCDLLAEMYGKITSAGIHKAPTIKVAEAAKVIENTQRDINIALMNELAVIFQALDIDTKDVLAAAGTKWNFLPFTPGLVGGHCIGVDPYYLTYKAESAGYHPEVILSGRRINDNMGKFIAQMAVKRLAMTGRAVVGAKVGILGLSFKENIPDLRNSKVIDVINELKEYNISCLIHDSEAYPEHARALYGIDLASFNEFKELDAVILAVAHDEYKKLSLDDIKKWFADQTNALIVDVKGLWNPEDVHAAGISYWRL